MHTLFENDNFGEMGVSYKFKQVYQKLLDERKLKLICKSSSEVNFSICNLCWKFELKKGEHVFSKNHFMKHSKRADSSFCFVFWHI